MIETSKRKLYQVLFAFLLALAVPTALPAQGWWSALRGAARLGQSFMIDDEQLAEYAKQQVAYMDKHNNVCSAQSAYTKRLNRLTRGMNDADGISLNFKVYQTKELNAFACEGIEDEVLRGPESVFWEGRGA